MIKKYSTTKRLINRPELHVELKKTDNFSARGGLALNGLYKENIPEKPLISIVTVVFNGEKYIEDTINSVLHQSYDNIEYVIIDGGSTDGTLDVIKNYENAIDIWVSGKDNGIYDAMNKGLSLTSGEWVNFMNCGDVFVSNDSILEMQFFLNTKKNCITSGNVRIVDSDGNYTGKKHPYAGTNYSELLKYNCVAHQATFVSKTVLDYLGGFESNFKIHGDYEFWIRAMVSNIEFNYVDIDIANFCNDGISSDRRLVPIAINERYLILKKHKVITPLEEFFYKKCSIFYYKIKTVIRYMLKKS